MASKLKDVSKLRLVLVEGDDYAKSAGEYSLTDEKFEIKAFGFVKVTAE